MFTLALSLYTGICNMYWAGADTRTRCLSCVIKLHRQQSDQRGFSTETQLVLTMCLHLSRPLWLLPSSRIFTTQEKPPAVPSCFCPSVYIVSASGRHFSNRRKHLQQGTPALIVTPLPSFSRNSSRNSSQLSFRIQFEVNLLKYLTLPKRATTRWSPVFVMIRISVQGEAPSPSYLDEDLFLTKR